MWLGDYMTLFYVVVGVLVAIAALCYFAVRKDGWIDQQTENNADKAFKRNSAPNPPEKIS
jgi:hypothetical protein